MANTYTGSDAGQAGLNVTEVDGSPNVFGVTKITVSNGTLTDDGSGSVTITTGGGGGGGVDSLSMGTTGLTPSTATTGAITVAGTLVVANGGTGATTASGARTSLGAAASGANSDITSLSGLTTPLSVAQGGTGANTLTNGGVLLGSGTGAISATAVLTNGQLLIGDGTGDPTVATLSAGTGITITNGAGSITIDAVNNGTVTSVGLTETGSALTITGSPVTNSGTINIAGAGTSSQVILGDLSLGTLTSGTVTSVSVNGSMDETGTSTDPNVGLNFIAIGPGVPSPGDPGAPPGFGFVKPPPDDTVYNQYGWVLFQAADLAGGIPPLYVPAWAGP